MFTATHILEPDPPYDFDVSAGFAVYGRGRYAADSMSDGVLSRALEIGDKTVALSIRSVGDVERPRIEARLEGDRLSSREESQAVELAVRLAGAQSSLAGFYNALDADDPMTQFASRFRGLGIAQSASPFEGLVHSILGQQISNEVARVLRDLLG